MSLRKLPVLKVPAPKAEVSYDLAPKALESWDSKVAAAQDDDVISILDPIGETYDGRGVTVHRIAADLRRIGDRPVTVQINSPGGNFFDGLAIYNLFRSHPKMVTAQVIGIAASAASVIAMAGDEIQIARAGLMMIHNAQWISIGDRHAMMEAHDSMAIFDRAMNGLYVDRTALPASKIEEMMDATTFMTGDDAVELGFATGLLEADETPTAVRALSDTSPLYRLEAVLARQGVSRAERRRLLKEIAASMPSAVGDNAMPGAGTSSVEDGSIGLSAALTRLKLIRP